MVAECWSALIQSFARRHQDQDQEDQAGGRLVIPAVAVDQPSEDRGLNSRTAACVFGKFRSAFRHWALKWKEITATVSATYCLTSGIRSSCSLFTLPTRCVLFPTACPIELFGYIRALRRAHQYNKPDQTQQAIGIGLLFRQGGPTKPTGTQGRVPQPLETLVPQKPRTGTRVQGQAPQDLGPAESTPVTLLPRAERPAA